MSSDKYFLMIEKNSGELVEYGCNKSCAMNYKF